MEINNLAYLGFAFGGLFIALFLWSVLNWAGASAEDKQNRIIDNHIKQQEK